MHMTLIAAQATLVLLVAGCTTMHYQPTNPPQAAEAPVAPAPLVGSYWRLTEVVTAEGWTAADPDQRAHIVLHADGDRLTGSTGCNRLTGSFELDDGGLRFGPTATTRMACIPEIMALEQKVLAALTATINYHLDGEILTLIGEGGDLARFERYLE